MNRRHTTGTLTFLVLLLSLDALLSSAAQGASQTQTPSTNHYFTSLQAAIQAASPGDDILIPPGTYTETLAIATPITLRAAHPGTVLITSGINQSYIMSINTPNVVLSGLAITNPTSGLYTTGLMICAPYTTIQDCTFATTSLGIACWTSNNTISDCTFSDCQDEGIAFLATPTDPITCNLVTGCRFQRNCDGIELQTCSHSRILDCDFTNNTHAGIDAIGSANNDNLIANNTFTQNGFGIYLVSSTANTISSCTFTSSPSYLTNANSTEFTGCSIDALSLRNHSSALLRQCTNITASHVSTSNSTLTFEPPVASQTLSPQPASGHAVASIWDHLAALLRSILHF